MAQMSSLKVKVCPIEWKFVWSPSLFLFLWIFLVDETGWIGWLSDNNSIFFSFPLLREVVRIKGITSLGAYQIHRLTWIPQKLQPETCLFPIVKREKGLSVKPTLHVVHSLHLQGAQEDGGGAPGVQGGGGHCSIFMATAIFSKHDKRLEWLMRVLLTSGRWLSQLVPAPSLICKESKPICLKMSWVDDPQNLLNQAWTAEIVVNRFHSNNTLIIS